MLFVLCQVSPHDARMTARRWYHVLHVTDGSTSHATISTTRGPVDLVETGTSSSSTAHVVDNDHSMVASTVARAILRTANSSMPGPNLVNQSTCRNQAGWTHSRTPQICDTRIDLRWRMGQATHNSSICRTTLVQLRIPVHRILTPAFHSTIISRTKGGFSLERSPVRLRARGVVVMVDTGLCLILWLQDPLRRPLRRSTRTTAVCMRAAGCHPDIRYAVLRGALAS